MSTIRSFFLACLRAVWVITISSGLFVLLGGYTFAVQGEKYQEWFRANFLPDMTIFAVLIIVFITLGIAILKAKKQLDFSGGNANDFPAILTITIVMLEIALAVVYLIVAPLAPDFGQGARVLLLGIMLATSYQNNSPVYDYVTG